MQTTKGRVSFGFVDPDSGIPAPGNRQLTMGQIMAEHESQKAVYRIKCLEAMAQDRGCSVQELQAAADFTGPGVLELPKYETEIMDYVRRRGVLGQRIRNVPATGQPSRYFEQRAIATGRFVNPRLIIPTPSTPQRSERAISIKALSMQINFGIFDVEVTRQQGMFSSLVSKDVEDGVTGMLRTSDIALWSGIDTDLANPTQDEYVGGLTQINRTFSVGPLVSIVDAIKAEIAAIVSSRSFEAKVTAAYAHPQTAELIDQEERLNHRQISEVDVTNADNEVIAGVRVMALTTAAGKIPIIPDWSLPAPTTIAAGPNAGMKNYPIVLVTEDLIEYHYITTPEPRVFVLGLLGNLATQYVGVQFGAVVFKGKADPASTPEVDANRVTYAHSYGTIIRA